MKTNGSVAIGYNKKPWTKSYNSSDEFYIEVKPVTEPLSSFKEEMKLNAKEIADTYHGEEIHVLYSGGMDSEAVLEAFRLANVPVKALVVRLPNGGNDEEIKWVGEYSSRTGFDNIEVIEFDGCWVYTLDCFKAMDEAQTPHPSVVWPLAALKENYANKVFALGIGEVEMQRKNGTWYLEENEEMGYGFYKAFKYFDLQGAAGFYTWSNRVILSWIKSSFWKNVNVPNSIDVKHWFYNYELGLTPRNKVNWYYKAGFKSQNGVIWKRRCFVPIKELGVQDGTKI